MKLPDNIEGLIKAQNELDSTAFAAYFTNLATVADERSSYSGRDEIKQWIQQASEKYQMKLKPIWHWMVHLSAPYGLPDEGFPPKSAQIASRICRLADGVSCDTLKT